MRVPGSGRIQPLSCQTPAERSQRPLLTSLIAGWLPNQKPQGIQSMFQFMAIHLPTSPDSQPSNTWLKRGGGLPCGCVCDVPRPVALRLVFPYAPSQPRVPRSPWRTPSPEPGLAWLSILAALASPTPDLSLKKVPLASEMQVRLGGSPRLKCSYSPPQTPCRLNRSFLMLCRFFYAYRTLAFPSVIHQLAGVCQCQWLGGHSVRALKLN